MKQTRDERYHFPPGAESGAWCHLAVYRSASGLVVAVCTDAPDNPGPSVTRASTQLAQAVWEQEDRPAAFIWVEHYPDEGRPELPESWRVVRFQSSAQGHFTEPQWQSVSPSTVAALLDADDPGVPAAWLALQGPVLQLDCGRCGQPLSISELLSGSQECAGCRRFSGSHKWRAPADMDLQAARAEWKRRYNAYEIRLGLSDAQRATLLQVLAGPRSLWDFTAAELLALAARLEEFHSAAEVEAFLSEQGAEDWPSTGR